MRLHGSDAYPVGFLPDGRLVTTGSTEAGIWTLGKDLPPLAIRLDTRQGPDPAPATATFVPGDRTILAYFRLDSPTLVHDLATGRLTGPLLDGAVVGSFGDPARTGDLIAAASPNGTVGIWNVQTKTQLATLPGGVPEGYTISWSPAGNVLAVEDGTAVELWNVTDPHHPTPLKAIPMPGPSAVQSLVFSPDGSDLAVASSPNGTVMMIDIAARGIAWSRTASYEGLRQIALSPDGKTPTAVDHGDPTTGQLTLLNAADGSPETSIQLPSYGGVNYVNHGQWLVITVNQTSPQAQLYDASTLQPIGAPFPTADAYGISVNNTGTMFSDAEINPLVWNADPANWVRTACSIAGRNLTRTEWRQYLPGQPYQRSCPQWPSGTSQAPTKPERKHSARNAAHLGHDA